MFVKKSNVLMKFVNGVKLDESIPCLRIGDNIINLCINLINISKLLSFIALFCEMAFNIKLLLFSNIMKSISLLSTVK